MRLPENHAARFVLTNEVHARPYEALEPPERAFYLAVMVEPDERARERAHVLALCERYGVDAPSAEAIHFSVDCGPFRLRWERHSEFTTYTVFACGDAGEPFALPASASAPSEWLGAIPGRTLVAAHAALMSRDWPLPPPAGIAALFAGNTVVGAEIGDGAGVAFTDFRVHADGTSRFLVVDRGLSRRQAGRMLQRLFEIETYRVLALLALPISRDAGPELAALERRLAELTATLAEPVDSDEKLLDELTRLAARGERLIASSRYRFGAARAYYDIVERRIAELRERRLPGTQTIEEFMKRRLAPALATIESVGRRELELSERVARASRLLSTRVDVARERQNQQLLASMDRRAKLQLRLQETVEGLSVAAITYYVVGLVGYGAKALKAWGIALDPDIAMGAAIPVVAVIAALGVRHVRRAVVKAERSDAL
ncbi:MAG: DUF3422 domain-containing protein [Burkholderiales bacterium]|nr:DUF3422 domain-containing protein [Burkholderiales bacterium]